VKAFKNVELADIPLKCRPIFIYFLVISQNKYAAFQNLIKIGFPKRKKKKLENREGFFP